MNGFQRVAGVISKCLHCGRLRDLSIETPECPTCRLFLQVICTAVTPLALNDISDDLDWTTAEEFLCRLVAQPDSHQC